MVFQRAAVFIQLSVSKKRLITMSALCFSIDWSIWVEGRGPINDRRVKGPVVHHYSHSAQITLKVTGADYAMISTS